MFEVKVYLKSGQIAEFKAESLPNPGDVPRWVEDLTNAPVEGNPPSLRNSKIVYLNLDDVAAIVVVA